MKSDKKKTTRRNFIKKSSLGALSLTSGFSIISSCSKKINSHETMSQIQKNHMFPDTEDRRPAIIHEGSSSMPTRILGKTGLEVSLLAFGGGSKFQANTTNWEEEIEKAIEVGINFFDTANDYIYRPNDHSESRYGAVLPKYRDDVIVCTKLNARDGDGAKAEFEDSLKRLKMDYVDILMVHGLCADDKFSVIENGIYKEMVKCKNEGTAKYIGFSVMSEDDLPIARQAIENLDVDVIIGVINPFKKYGNVYNLLSLIREKNIGMMAMKLMRDMVNKLATPKELIEYTLNHEGICGGVIAHTTIDILQQNVDLVIAYAASTGVRMGNSIELEERFKKLAGNFVPCWARPGYRDGGNIMV
jgi:diketogulonate reductase-like aldo/keto reductase